MPALGAKVAYHGADMSKPAEIEAMMKFAAAQFGRVDILVNNAGIQHVAPVEDFPPEKWDAIIAINLSSAFHASRLALPAMKAANWGRIINVASVHGLVASAQKSAYVAAKHGLVGLTKVTALENATTRRDLQRDLPRLGADAAGAKAGGREGRRQRLDQRRGDASNCSARRSRRCSSRRPRNWASSPCSSARDAANNVRGVAWNMDGGWAAQ